jgi:nicotinamide mononucleotide transporter
VGLNLLFFVPTGIIGFFMWKRHAVDHVVRMRSLSRQARLACFVGTFVAVLGLGWILGKIPSQNTPYVDASTNVLSVIATFLMMWRFKEQWILYMTLNVITIVMWVLRWQAEGEAGDLMVLMWVLFLANSIFGYWRWSRGARLMTEGEAS